MNHTKCISTMGYRLFNLYFFFLSVFHKFSGHCLKLAWTEKSFTRFHFCQLPYHCVGIQVIVQTHLNGPFLSPLWFLKSEKMRAVNSVEQCEKIDFFPGKIFWRIQTWIWDVSIHRYPFYDLRRLQSVIEDFLENSEDM